MSKYRRKSRVKYMLKVHLIFVTKYRKKLFDAGITTCIKDKISDIAERDKYIITAMEVDKDHIHILLEYSPSDSISNIVKSIKQETTYAVWEQFENRLKFEYYKKRIFWSDGYFACSIGDASSKTIEAYINSRVFNFQCVLDM